jgi:hypothetical protein
MAKAARSGDGMNSIENNMKAVRAFTRIFKNEHNVDGVDHLFAQDFQHHFAPPLRPGLRVSKTSDG